MSFGPRRAALAGAVLTAAAVLAGCSDGVAQPLVPVANPAVAPQPEAVPAGMVLSTAAVSALAVDPATRLLAVGARHPDRVLLHGLDDLAAGPLEVPIAGRAATLTPARDVLLVAVPEARSLTKIALPGGVPRGTPRLDEPVVDAAVSADHTVLAQGETVAIRDPAGDVHLMSGFADAARLVPIGDRVAVLDRARSSVTLVDPVTREAGPALRVGEGATSAVADRFGRVLVVDTREGELLVLAGDPLLLRQRFPVAGSPYGLAYDQQRDLAWVTLTARNEVVGLDVAGGEPVVLHRFPTVRQPDSVAVDPDSGRVFVGSASGAGLQVIDPGQV